MRRISFIVMLICISFFSLRVSAQDDSAIYKGTRILNLQWSSDGKFLVFKDESDEFGLVTESDSWKIYDIQEQELESTNSYPFLVSLTSEEKLQLNLIEDISMEDSKTSLQFLSSESHYLLYRLPSQVINGAHTFPTLALANLDSMTYLDLGIMVSPTQHTGTDNFNVLWSSDESSLVVKISNDYGENHFFYIYNYSEKLKNTEHQWLNNLFPEGKLINVYDISADGSQVLAQVELEGIVNPQVALITPKDSDTTLIDLGKVIGIIFTEDNNSLLFVNDQGLGKYEIQSGDIQIINSAINSSWADYILFDPTLKYIAIVDNDNEIAQLYIDELEVQVE